MNARTVWLGCGVVLLCIPAESRAETPTPEEGRALESEVRAIFQAKCTHCHGADVERPRAGFGYVLDLRRVAANRSMIVPARPDESELWAMVKNEEMPPPDSPDGPLTTRDKESIRAWIDAGAPVAAPPQADSGGEAVAGHSPRTPAGRLLRWLGKFHLLLLHFPIALVMVAGGSEAWSAWRADPASNRMVHLCLWLAAVAVVPTAAFGWLHALGGPGASSPGLLLLHRWLGTASAAWVIATAVLVERTARPSRWTRAMVFTCVVLVAVVAHLGGLLTHGERFFDW